MGETTSARTTRETANPVTPARCEAASSDDGAGGRLDNGGVMRPGAVFYRSADGRGLPNDVMVLSLSFLLSVELGAVRCTCASLGRSPDADRLVAAVVAALVQLRYGLSSPDLREGIGSWPRNVSTLRLAELRHVAALLQLPAPRLGRGFLISSTWCSNLRRYVETEGRRLRQCLTPGSNGGGNGGSSSGRKGRGRERAESNVMPPWPEVNLDITCTEHGGLAKSNQTRGKRRTIDKRAWRQLRLYFPGGPEYGVDASECIQCSVGVLAAKKAQQDTKESRAQEIATPHMQALFSRKTGVPPSALAPIASAGGGAAAAAGGDAGAGGGAVAYPLLPGIYHVLPRCWLTSWRAYVRDPAAARPRMPETSVLLCEGHGRLLAPPHLEEYIFGHRRNLLGSLDPDRSGCVCEILLPEEWDALMLLYPCDLCVRFCITLPPAGFGGEPEVAWSIDRCRECDACYIGEVFVKGGRRKLTF